jgi:invasion protein IalB
VFTLSATPTDTNFCTGSAVSIAGAGAAGAALTGIVGVVDVVSAVKTFTLHSATNGSAVPCLTDVTAVACTYQAQPTASVPVQYRGSGTVNPGAIVATGQVDVDIAAPTGVTLPSGAEVSIGLSGNPTAGIAYVNPRVKSGGAFVTVTVINYNNISSVTPSPLTVKYSVLG